MSKPDRHGLQPVARGRVRGRIVNVRKTAAEGDFGEMTILDFDLDRGAGLPPVAVQMRGNDFSQPIYAGWLADVDDPDPAVRPILTRRVRFPQGDASDLISYYPGQDKPNRAQEATVSAVFVIGPLLLAVAGALALLAWQVGWL